MIFRCLSSHTAGSFHKPCSRLLEPYCWFYSSHYFSFCFYYLFIFILKLSQKRLCSIFWELPTGRLCEKFYICIFLYVSGTIWAQFLKSFPAVRPICMKIGVYHLETTLTKSCQNNFDLLNHRFEPITFSGVAHKD